MKQKNIILAMALYFSLSVLLSLGLALHAYALDVYVMDSSDSTNNNMTANALTNAGHTVTIGKSWHLQDGNESLLNYDVVVFLNNYNWSAGSMPAAGQTEIINFVSDGGGLVTSEWWVWNIGIGSRFPALAPLSPAVPTTTYRTTATITYAQATPDPILNDGVSSPFLFLADNVAGSETRFQARLGAVVFYSSSYEVNAGGVLGWNYDQGRVISFSTVIGNNEMGNSNYRKLFVNAVEWSASGFSVGDLHYTPVTPCRIVDTRKAGRAITAGGIRSYNVRGAVASQGGNSVGCPSSKGEPHAVHINVTSVPLGNGWLTAYPYNSTPPTASIVNYRSDAQNVANSGTIKTCVDCNKDISIKSGGGKTHVIIDVLGYYYSKP